jgi:hypothetical protein
MMDQGARALIVKPDGAELMTIPKGAPETFGIQQKWNVKVHDDGSATADCEMTWRGDMAVRMREMFSVEGQRGLMLQQLFSAMLGKMKIAEQKFDDLKDLSKPEATFRVTIEIEKFVKGSGDSRTLPTGFIDIAGQFLRQYVALKKREHDLIVTMAMDFRTEADYELPAGWSVVAPPEDSKMELPCGAFTSVAKSDGGKLNLVRDLRLLGERVKAADYPAFREAATKAFALTQQQWKVKKGDAATPPAAGSDGAAPAVAPAPKPSENGGGK